MSQPGPASTRNILLDSLPEGDLALLRAHLEQVRLERRTVLVAAGVLVERAYFPQSGIASRHHSFGRD